MSNKYKYSEPKTIEQAQAILNDHDWLATWGGIEQERQAKEFLQKVAQERPMPETPEQALELLRSDDQFLRTAAGYEHFVRAQSLVLSAAKLKMGPEKSGKKTQDTYPKIAGAITRYLVFCIEEGKLEVNELLTEHRTLDAANFMRDFLASEHGHVVSKTIKNQQDLARKIAEEIGAAFADGGLFDKLAPSPEPGKPEIPEAKLKDMRGGSR